MRKAVAAAVVLVLMLAAFAVGVWQAPIHPPPAVPVVTLAPAPVASPAPLPKPKPKPHRRAKRRHVAPPQTPRLICDPSTFPWTCKPAVGHAAAKFLTFTAPDGQPEKIWPDQIARIEPARGLGARGAKTKLSLVNAQWCFVTESVEDCERMVNEARTGS